MLQIDMCKLASQQQKRYETDFKELGKIGKGGFSKVYKVRNQVDNQLYAIKKVELTVKEIRDDFEVKLERMLREARYLAKLSHPRIIRYFNSWVEVVEKRVPTESQPRLSDISQRSFNKKPEEIVLYFDNESQESFKELDGLVEFKQQDSQIQASQSFQINFECKRTVMDVLNQQRGNNKSKKQEIPNTNNNLLQQQLRLNANEYISFSEFELSSNNDEPTHPKDVIQFKQRMKKSISQECKQLDDKKKNQSFDQFEKVIIYIQTEICERSLEDYLNQRNAKLIQLRKTDKLEYQTQLEQYHREAKTILNQIVSGLEYIHKKRLIHRDLKPGNIFMNTYNDVKIGDFGLMKKLERHKQEEPSESKQSLDSPFMSNNFCTKLYASPEQIDGGSSMYKTYDHRMDIHALGIIILQLFHPMNTSMEVIKTIQDARKGLFPTTLQQSVAQVVEKCLHKDPKQRPSLEDIVADLVCQSPLHRSGALSGTSGTSTAVTDLLSPTDKEQLGLVDVQMEQKKPKQRYLMVLGRQLLIYHDANDQKALNAYNLDECKWELKQNAITISHPLLQTCTLLFKEENQCKRLLSHFTHFNLTVLEYD